jgi:hypothetical protein
MYLAKPAEYEAPSKSLLTTLTACTNLNQERVRQ